LDFPDTGARPPAMAFTEFPRQLFEGV
jgi:hypothetical protein